MSKKSKEKGNRNERKIAKELSKWMFNDETILFRDATSGARKVAYSGDVVPIKQMPKWKKFLFFMELKCGYNNDIATFYNQKLLTDWIIKAASELTEEQYILLLIIKHDYKSIFVIINQKLSILPWTLAININNKIYYSYMYNDLLSININDFLKDLGIKTKII